MGELHLEIIVDGCMKREFGSRPTSASRRSPTAKRAQGGDGRLGKFVCSPGGKGQYGHAVKIDGTEPGKGFEFENKVGGAREFIPAVEKGWTTRCPTGAARRLPVVDVKVTLIDGAYHDVDSKKRVQDGCVDGFAKPEGPTR